METIKAIGYDLMWIELPTQKAAGLQGALRGVLNLVKPCCSSSMNPAFQNANNDSHLDIGNSSRLSITPLA
jgi:hypothetical protein